ncbi:MAG: methyltransferase domain-containing protein [Ruminococcus sp.]|nr:methyltransferase domain-containing protein [Ruminococcus sp.]
MKNRVFLSFKNTNADGTPSQESDIASRLYGAFVEAGIPTFFSNVSLMEFGEAAYKDAIEKALDEAEVLVLVGTSIEHITSRWVKYEWSSFHEEILSGDKKNGVIVPYLSSSILRRDRPIALRNLESFACDRDEAGRVVEFVKNILSRPENAAEGTGTPAGREHIPDGETHSSYNPTAYREHTRLKIQAENTRDADMPAIRYALDGLKGKETVNVLDLGCAYGYVTRDRFGGIPGLRVFGVDRQQACVDYANAHNRPDNFTYATMDVEAPDFADRMTAAMEEWGVEKFDLVIATLFIHHLTDPIGVLRGIRRYLSNDGYIIIRGSDDGSVIAYNDDGLVQKIIDKHLSTPGISDRRNGRKIYFQLYTSGYKQIRMMNYVKEISGCDFDRRMDIFDERFAYRRNYLKNLLDKDPSNMTYKNNLEWMDYALKKLETLFGNDSFWYQEVDFVAVARKK